jgi:hypothetical protein
MYKTENDAGGLMSTEEHCEEKMRIVGGLVTKWWQKRKFGVV